MPFGCGNAVFTLFLRPMSLHFAAKANPGAGVRHMVHVCAAVGVRACCTCCTQVLHISYRRQSSVNDGKAIWCWFAFTVLKWFDFLDVRNCTIHFLSLTLQE